MPATSADRVRLDRYARKSSDHLLQPNDLVVASIERTFDREARKVESREIGHVCKVHEDNHFDVRIDNDQKEVVERIPRHRLEYVIEKTYQDICERVAKAVSMNDPEFAQTIFDLMVAEKFIAAGRILAGAGRPDYTLTLFNCYVFNPTGDSRSAITKHWGRLFETYSRGGGVGTPLSILRPRGAIVRKVNGRSSGSVSWAEQFSQITGAVEQGGSRRGAAMLSQWCWHPDILEFIQAKALREEFRTQSGEVVSRNQNLIKNANVSVMISNDFMKAVEQDAEWDLVFPDLDDPDYDKEWDGNLWRWRDDLGKPVITYQTVRAKHLWDQIIQRAWESGEPGIIFMERANDMSNSYYYAYLCGSNPCSEQVLADSSVCNLAHLNLSKFVFVDDQFPEQERTGTAAAKQVDWEGITQAIHAGIRFLDNINDLNQYHDAKVEEQQTKERRIGLGLLGYGEMLLRLGLRYGSEEAVKFTDRLLKHFCTESYLASSELAKERGPFPAFKSDLFLRSGFMKRHTKAVKEAVERNGMRNVTVNTVAPTGSIASVLQTSSGCEPFFELEYTSTTRIGVVTERPPVGQEIVEKFGTNRSKWPDYVVTAHKGITPEQHVRTQAAMQRWVDAALSKTINLPNSATAKDVSDAYRLMWELGCKGGTVYRDGSRDEQVLYLDTVEPEEIEVEVVVDNNDDLGIVLPRPDVGHSVTFSEKSPIGTVHATMRHEPQSGEIVDFFVLMNTGDAAADAEAIGRLISLILRWPNNRQVNQQTRLTLIRDQLMGILGRGQEGMGPTKKLSLPDTIAKIIDRYMTADFPMGNIPYGFIQMKNLLDDLREIGSDREAFDKKVNEVLYGESNGDADEAIEQYREEVEEEIKQAEADGINLPYDLCPDCGNGTLVTIPGKCPYCRNCGYSRC